ncbi:MAG: T9SS type A sorting domain-containing protein, partial [Bacteroidota bacterium]|nr:T9SS type A sorting domain-containing protein [Bacteroidota bacterium]
VIIGFAGFPSATSGTYFNSNVLTAVQETWLLSNLFYANIHNSLFPGGEIRAQIIPNIPAAITCPPNVVLSNTPGLCSRSVSFAATATGNPSPAITYKIGTTTISSPYNFPVGTTTVTATAMNTAGAASCSFTVTINDTEAPKVTNMSANPDNLWPPNHKMRDVTINYTSTDNCPGVINCHLSVTSNEPVNGQGDGNTAVDWIVIDDHHVKLRAERSGGGDGRIYTITATCTDAHGNSGSNSTTVTVSHDKSSSVTSRDGLSPDMKMMATGLSLKAFPNPARNEFKLNIQTDNSEKISVRVTDVTGRIVESKYNLTGTQMISVGNNLKAGVYIVRVMQGNESMQLKLVKIE